MRGTCLHAEAVVAQSVHNDVAATVEFVGHALALLHLQLLRALAGHGRACRNNRSPVGLELLVDVHRGLERSQGPTTKAQNEDGGKTVRRATHFDCEARRCAAYREQELRACCEVGLAVALSFFARCGIRQARKQLEK
eukprot:1225818-Prymnesium_polylepis.2